MENKINQGNQIAYLIQAYADYVAFKELVRELLDMENCHIFVHLDSKSDISLFEVKDERVHFIENRELVSWAGYKQGKLMFNLMDEVLKFPIKFDSYCFLSESDYPVYSGDELISRIKDSRSIFINCSKIQKNKIEQYWFYDFGIKSVNVNKIVSKTVNSVLEFFYKLRILKKKNTVSLNGKEVDVYCSGPFWRYDHEQLNYINKTFNDNKKFQNYFKSSFAACELMVSTIIANSKYAQECVFVDEYINLNEISSLCYFKYTGPRVNVLTEADYEDIMASGKPFIRKVKQGFSDELVKRIKANW